MDIWVGHAHNLFLMLSAENRLPVTFLFYGLFATIVLTSVRLFHINSLLPVNSITLFSYMILLISLLLY